mmetsp:Transcript_22614/g.57527  ORF Transcript_22614/g.57527 Transcript_22614/m.57527 type:complete len:203 (+) Transcript_22614:1056-1664(+)
MVLPSVTGRMLFRNACDQVMLAPMAMPRGMKNMLATECSRPMVTKVAMGAHRPIILPGSVVAAAACHTAMHTSQLHRMERMKTSDSGRDTAFMVATLTGTGLPASTPVACTAATANREPIRLPVHDQNQLCSMPPSVACFSYIDMGMTAVLPVNSSVPDRITMVRPTGKTRPPISLTRPGMVGTRLCRPPTTDMNRKPPRPM